jgi:hypothetical protein
MATFILAYAALELASFFWCSEGPSPFCFELVFSLSKYAIGATAFVSFVTDLLAAVLCGAPSAGPEPERV